MPVQTLQIMDMSNNTVVKAVNCRIKRPPEIERAEDVGHAEWVILCGNLDILVGGSSTGTYDALLVAMVYYGIPLVGLAKGTFVKASRNEDDWKQYVGSEGEVVWSRLHDKTGVVTFTLKNTSSSNADLTAIMVSDQIPLPA